MMKDKSSWILENTSDIKKHSTSYLMMIKAVMINIYWWWCFCEWNSSWLLMSFARPDCMTTIHRITIRSITIRWILSDLDHLMRERERENLSLWMWIFKSVKISKFVQNDYLFIEKSKALGAIFELFYY